MLILWTNVAETRAFYDLIRVVSNKTITTEYFNKPNFWLVVYKVYISNLLKSKVYQNTLQLKLRWRTPLQAMGCVSAVDYCFSLKGNYFHLHICLLFFLFSLNLKVVFDNIGICYISNCSNGSSPRSTVCHQKAVFWFQGNL